MKTVSEQSSGSPARESQWSGNDLIVKPLEDKPTDTPFILSQPPGDTPSEPLIMSQPLHGGQPSAPLILPKMTTP